MNSDMKSVRDWNWIITGGNEVPIILATWVAVPSLSNSVSLACRSCGQRIRRLTPEDRRFHPGFAFLPFLDPLLAFCPFFGVIYFQNSVRFSSFSHF